MQISATIKERLNIWNKTIAARNDGTYIYIVKEKLGGGGGQAVRAKLPLRALICL